MVIPVKFLIDNIRKTICVILLLSQTVEAMIYFMPREQFIATSDYIVVASVQAVNNAGKKVWRRGLTGNIVKNKLQVIELIKSTGVLENPFVLYTLKFDQWMEDNAVLPSKGSKVLLFLKRNEKGELKPVNGLQGIWRMNGGQPVGIGSGTTLNQVRETVRKQKNSCESDAFASLVDTAEIQIQVGHYREALKAYRKAYRICPVRDLEEEMAWLMGEAGERKKYKEKGMKNVKNNK